MKRKFNVIIPADIKPRPKPHEESAAAILAEYFKSDVKFLRRTANKSADILVMKTSRKYEIKSPTGKGKHNIQHNLQNAADQSSRVVLDARRSKIHMSRFLTETKRQFGLISKIREMIVIAKNGETLDFKK